MFFSNKRYTDKQIEELTTAVLTYGTTGEDSPSKIQEMIQKSARADVYHKTKLYQPSSRRDSGASSASSEGSDEGEKSSPFGKFDFITDAKTPSKVL